MAEYIEREKTVELLRSLGNREYRKEKGTIQDAIKMISYPEYTPAADVAPVIHARWIEDHDYLKCPECGVMVKRDFTFFDIGDWNCCPNCGTKMDEEEACEADIEKTT